MSVIISEVAGAGRWSQFNLKMGWVEPFFGAAPGQIGTIHLTEFPGLTGVPTQTYAVPEIHKTGSTNWGFEIPNASTLRFPGKNTRPILFLHKDLAGRIRFKLVMPVDAGYNAMAVYLSANRETPARELARCRVQSSAFPTGGVGGITI